MLRRLWLMVTSDNARDKAYNFLKLIKPPDGTVMDDTVIKLDWNKDTTDQWTQNDAKTSMDAAGFDWERRDTGRPLGTDNFRVIYRDTGTVTVPAQIPFDLSVTAGDPVLHFELLEQWMGPALAPVDPSELRQGVSPVENLPGTLYDEWPSPGTPDGDLNTLRWITILVGPALSDSDYWWRTTIQKVRDTAASSNKVSRNGNGDSVWFRWTSVEDPDLGSDEIWLFEQNANGDPEPIRARMEFAV